NTPKSQDGCDLEKVKAAHFPAGLKRTEKNHYFGGKICETGQSDGGKGTETKGKTGKGHRFAKPAEILEKQCPGSFSQFAAAGKEQRDGQTVSEHQNGGSGYTQNACC